MVTLPIFVTRLLNLTGLDTLLPAHPTAAHALVAHTRSPDTATA
ncbi:hypothetical protein [Streptomyces sp. NPDC060333]